MVSQCDIEWAERVIKKHREWKWKRWLIKFVYSLPA